MCNPRQSVLPVSRPAAGPVQVRVNLRTVGAPCRSCRILCINLCDLETGKRNLRREQQIYVPRLLLYTHLFKLRMTKNILTHPLINLEITGPCGRIVYRVNLKKKLSWRFFNRENKLRIVERLVSVKMYL